ncbi:amino acid adenylation domain-containing protein [Sphingobacterium sp. UT-1RO-CII-1]|uniref:amino acid adenylation domain-containing protein n=1 Tax=Sphingobacterium sp. UT-1RO-CII-1 TaxID=2995225 RepID=UPI00227D33E2|nr:amino acid adenylation domain-containing protein [Sphingobacterium sp. UT-1RO-CII-1]MCY4778548.1 amino acid adenylation domain-containing protein [Sphingobacterium sp. UT-1RO-CII-1]
MTNSKTNLDVDENTHLNLFNQTSWQFDEKATLLSLFQNVCKTFPRHTAASCGNQKITYQELDIQSNILRDVLLTNNTDDSPYIPILLNRSIEWLVSVVAVIKTGAAYVPIDPSFPEQRVNDILKDTDCHILITNSDLFSPQVNPKIKHIDPISVPHIDNYISKYPDRLITSEDLAYTIFTSGSTGKPKGVQIKHKSIQHLITWHNTYFKVGPTSKLSLTAGLAFDICVWELWSGLCSGAELFIATDEERTNATALTEYFAKNHISHGFAPTVLVPDVVRLSRDHSTLKLKYLFTAGEKLKPTLTSDLPYELIDYYGPTECTVFSTFRTVVDINNKYVASIGRPIANTKAYVLDKDKKPVPIGVIGELHIGGIALADGYLNNKTLTDEKFINNPFIPNEKIYCTGDLATWNTDGTLVFFGRKDNQVKIRGYRIELSEIENTLTQYPGIEQATVISRENKAGNQYLIGFIVSTNLMSMDLNSIRQRLKKHLPSYMIPAQLIQISKIPLTVNGKTDINKLYDLADKDAENSLLLEPPQNFTEEVIAHIWSEELERPIINITDNFFDIGGDSFLVAVVTVAIEEKLNTKVYIRDIYQYPILKDLSDILIARSKKSEIPVEDVEPFVELQNDVYLKKETVFDQPFDSKQIINPENIFLTGITGFVGIHLVKDLIKSNSKALIYCLIRAEDSFKALEKIRDCFKKYLISYDEDDIKRIIPVLGDLNKDRLGIASEIYDNLTSEIDIIYHSASSVNFIEPYSYMKQPNVEGLREIIHFASINKTKCLALLSTISVYSWGHVFTGKQIMREDDDISQNLLSVSKDIGYVRSKWVMEAIADLAEKKGLPLITYRLGYAMCHSVTGASAPYQWWSGLVKNCFDFKSYPALNDLREGLITVDYMTKTICHISTNPEAIGKKFNLIAKPETNLTLIDFFEKLNTYYKADLKPLTYKSWRMQWENDTRNRLYPLTSLFKDNMHEGLSTVELYQHTYIWDCSNVTEFLKGSGITEPIFDKQLLDNYLNYLRINV